MPTQTYATITLSTQSGATVFGHLADRTDSLRASFEGASAPGTPVTGQTWFDSGNNILHYYDGSGWVEVGTDVQADVDYNLNELTNARIENTASDPTPSAGNVGYVVTHTGAGKLKVVTDSGTLETVASFSNVDHLSVPLPLRSWEKDGTNPPTDTTVGTTPAVQGWLFDAVNERMHTTLRLPRGYSEDANVILRVHCILNAAETASDTIDAVLDYKKLTLDSTDAANGTSTQVTASDSIGANAGQYTYHKVDLVLAFNDADNPLLAGDLLALSWGLDAVSSVAEVLAMDAELLVPIGPVGISEVA